MLAHQFLEDYFKREYDKVLKKADENGFSKLNQEDKTILLLNYHTNHYNHLEIELNQKIDNLDKKVDTGLRAVNDKIDKVEERLNNKIDKVEERLNDKIYELHKGMNSLFLKFIIAMGGLMTIFSFAESFFLKN